MKKLICALGMGAILSLGLTNKASAQYGYGTYPQQTSSRAKGAIIGGGLGAAAGAIINRQDPVAGGIVGAVLGAGAGYIIGNNEDKVRANNAYYNNNYNYNNGYRRNHRGAYRNNNGYYQQRRVYNNYNRY